MLPEIRPGQAGKKVCQPTNGPQMNRAKRDRARISMKARRCDIPPFIMFIAATMIFRQNESKLARSGPIEQDGLRFYNSGAM